MAYLYHEAGASPATKEHGIRSATECAKLIPNSATPSGSINIATDNGRQLIVGTWNATHTSERSRLSRHGFLDANEIETVRLYTKELLNDIALASNQCDPLITSSDFLGSQPNSAYISPNPSHPRNNFMGIKRVLDNCEGIIRSFLKTTRLPKCVDVQRLQEGLERQLVDLVPLLCLDQKPRQKTGNLNEEIQQRFQGIDEVVESLLDSLLVYTSYIPRLYLHDQSIVLKEPDRCSASIHIPRAFCASNQEFHGFLRFLFRHRPWASKIDREEYLLEDEGLATVVKADNWQDAVIPGAELFMTMIFKREGTVSNTSCERCRSVNIKPLSGKKLQCRSCSFIFDVVETNRFVELPEEDSDTSTKDPQKELATGAPLTDSNASPLSSLGILVEEQQFSRIRYETIRWQAKERARLRDALDPEAHQSPYATFLHGALFSIGVLRDGVFHCMHLHACAQRFNTAHELQVHFDTAHFPFTRIDPGHRFICSVCQVVSLDAFAPCNRNTPDSIQLWICGNFIKRRFMPTVGCALQGPTADTFLPAEQIYYGRRSGKRLKRHTNFGEGTNW